MFAFNVYRTPSNGTVIVKFDAGDRIVGWAVPGANDYLTRDLKEIAKHIASGHYQKATREYTSELQAFAPQLFTAKEATAQC